MSRLSAPNGHLVSVGLCTHGVWQALASQGVQRLEALENEARGAFNAVNTTAAKLERAIPTAIQAGQAFDAAIALVEGFASGASAAVAGLLDRLAGQTLVGKALAQPATFQALAVAAPIGAFAVVDVVLIVWTTPWMPEDTSAEGVRLVSSVFAVPNFLLPTLLQVVIAFVQAFFVLLWTRKVHNRLRTRASPVLHPTPHSGLRARMWPSASLHPVSHTPPLELRARSWRSSTASSPSLKDASPSKSTRSSTRRRCARSATPSLTRT